MLYTIKSCNLLIKCLQIRSCRTAVSGWRLAFFRTFATEHSNFLHYNASMHNVIMTNRCRRIDISPLPYSLKSNAVFCLFVFSFCGFSFLWMGGYFKFRLKAAPAHISTWWEEPARLCRSFIFFLSAVTECWFQPAQECDTPDSYPFFGADSKSHSNKSYRWLLYLETPRFICARAEASMCTALLLMLLRLNIFCLASPWESFFQF